MGGFFDGFRGSFGVRRYKHDELDGDEVATSFINNTTELEVLGHHRRLGPHEGIDRRIVPDAQLLGRW